jgi:hypothetical protein
MSLKTKKKTSFAIPEGSYDGVLVAIYDLGTQDNEMYKKEQEQVLFVWELIDEDNVNPLTINRFYNNSHHENADLRKDFGVLTGRSLTAEEEESGIELKSLLGIPAHLQVVNVKKKGKERPKIMSVMKFREKRKVTPKSNLVYFDMTESMELPKDTPDWIAQIIQRSREFREGVVVTSETNEKTESEVQELSQLEPF